jgi:hypothetical protein
MLVTYQNLTKLLPLQQGMDGQVLSCKSLPNAWYPWPIRSHAQRVQSKFCLANHFPLPYTLDRSVIMHKECNLSGRGGGRRIGVENQNCIRFLFQGGKYETTGAVSESYSVNLKHKHTYKSYMTHCSKLNSEHDVGRKKNVSHKFKCNRKLGTHDSPYSIPA